MAKLYKRQYQQNLFQTSARRFFGGELLYNRRKSRRPFSTREPLHLVLRSSWGRGMNSFLQKRNKKAIEKIIQFAALKYGIRIYEKAIVGNHIHLLVRCKCKKSYHAFISVISGQIASHVMRYLSYKNFKKYFSNTSYANNFQRSSKNAGGGQHQQRRYKRQQIHKQSKGQQFWDFRPFSRIVTWGLDFRNCLRYVNKNMLEAEGYIPLQPRSISQIYQELLKVASRAALLKC